MQCSAERLSMDRRQVNMCTPSVVRAPPPPPKILKQVSEHEKSSASSTASV